MHHPVVQSDIDRYVIVDYIAEGGMGAIYLGKKVAIGGFEKEVVLKQLLPEFTSTPEFIDLFLREAKLSALLDHPNIVHTIDLVTAKNDYFIVMEYVRGGDIRTLMRRIKLRGFSLSPQGALFIADEILNALGYAHARIDREGKALKLIHRDISPSNIMVSAEGEVKLADFGIAKVSTYKSVFYRVKGKVGYMSPEQATGDRPLDHRSDLYSLGICLYELLTGEKLFIADLLSSPEEIFSQPLPNLSKRGLPTSLNKLLEKALSRDPDKRFQTADDFQHAIEKLRRKEKYHYTASDLSSELKEKCGKDARKWIKEDDLHQLSEERHTALISQVEDHYSNIELTSLMKADSIADIDTNILFADAEDEFDKEQTMQIHLPPKYGDDAPRMGIAFAPTQQVNTPIIEGIVIESRAKRPYIDALENDADDFAPTVAIKHHPHRRKTKKKPTKRTYEETLSAKKIRPLVLTRSDDDSEIEPADPPSQLKAIHDQGDNTDHSDIRKMPLWALILLILIAISVAAVIALSGPTL